ncbi:hypothetical protein ADL25_24300 [Streptomyces sp. NRRL F-5122]|nr:hypothetical protein ADL25_24300 [Streptomyces sp. NRRL F-5122]
MTPIPQLGCTLGVLSGESLRETFEVSSIGVDAVQLGGFTEDHSLRDAVDLRLLLHRLSGHFLECRCGQLASDPLSVDQRVVDVPQYEVRHAEPF